MIEADLIAYLLADSRVSAAIGDRLRPLEGRKGDAPPFLVYEILTRNRDQSQAGETGLVEASVKFQAFGTNYLQIRAVESALRSAFHSFQNRAMGDSWVQWAKFRDAQDADQPPIFKDQFGLWQGIFNLSIAYEEAEPAQC